MEDYFGLIILALFYIIPRLLKKKEKAANASSRPPALPPLPIPSPKREMSPVNDIPLDLKTAPIDVSKRAPLKKNPVFVRKVRKKRNIHTLLKDLPNKKEVFILGEILKKPAHKNY